MNVHNFLQANNIDVLGGRGELRPVTRLVANIPWGEARAVEEVLEKNKGTCTGKHLLLQACFDILGIPHRPVVCTFRWKDQAIEYPPELRELLGRTDWLHGHNFLQVEDEGTWIDIDVTWDPPLKPFGFPTFPEDWNGTTPFVGVDPIVERFDGVSIEKMKKELIEALSPDQREVRELFLKKFIEWIDGLR